MNIKRKAARQEKKISSLQRKINKLEEENKNLRMENKELRDTEKLYLEQSNLIDDLKNELQGNIEELSKLKTDYRDAIREAHTIKAKMLKEFTPLIKDIKSKF